MSELGTYRFLPWLRRGIGAGVTDIDNGSLPNRSRIDVILNLSSTLDGSTTNTPIDKSVSVYGPGDAIGIDPNMVIRTEPRAYTSNFEPNYLAGIEFSLPDLPWLLTPAIANGDRLRPWLALIVLKKDEFTEPIPQTTPLPSISITKMSALQNLDENWNFAHVQVSADCDVSQLLVNDPGHVISRLLCPRRLDPETDYDAFLVPAFDLGCKVGLGIDISADKTTTLAWTDATQAPYRTPYYYRFHFHTSDEGDFESLVRRLVPVDLPPNIGQRPVAVSNPGLGYPSAGPPLNFQGALIKVGTQLDSWSDPGRTNFQGKLVPYINETSPPTVVLSNPGEDPKVVPPIYGHWHAGRNNVNPSFDDWLDTLNTDPRWRSPAGFGTEVVQTKRTALLASAWQQVDGIIAANRILRQAQLSRGAMTQIYKQHFELAGTATLLSMTSPIHPRIRASPNTVLASLRNSPIPLRVLSGAFRKVVRPLGPIRRRQRALRLDSGQLISGINDGSYSIVPFPGPPRGTISIDQVSDTLLPTSLKELEMPPLLFIELLILVITLLIFTLIRMGNRSLAYMLARAFELALGPILEILRQNAEQIQASDALRITRLTTSAVAKIPQNPTFTVTSANRQRDPAATLNGGGDSPDASAFRRAMGDFAELLQTTQPEKPRPNSLDLDRLQTTILSRIDPSITVPNRVLSVISISNRLWAPVDPITPIMAAPDFPQAMYAPLRDLSQEYILPGVGLIPPNSLGLLQSNNAFIESYMVGLNHEMARQLLVNHYPTDQRGSYFRQFWDVSAYVPQEGDPADPQELREMLKDIPPIHTWPKSTKLGDNKNPKNKNIVKGNLVLVIRGELLKRYPNTIIFAGKAIIDGQGKLALDESEGAEKSYKHPIFIAKFAPDITCVGFDLTASEAIGDANSPNGYFFGFQQVPTEPRFGLEPDQPSGQIQYWSDLTWANFAEITPQNTSGHSANTSASTNFNFVGGYSASRLQSSVFKVTLSSGKLPDFLPATKQPIGVTIGHGDNPANALDQNVSWGKDSAQSAYVLLRRPFRIMVHAKRMLDGLT